MTTHNTHLNISQSNFYRALELRDEEALQGMYLVCVIQIELYFVHISVIGR
jgi:hypothetical protein